MRFPGLVSKALSRERVIVDIESLGQALKLEQTVRTGYCDPIIENLLAWIAIEEDLASSYDKLLDKHQEEKRKVVSMLSDESKRNIELLHGLLKSVEEFGVARDQRIRMIEQVTK